MLRGVGLISRGEDEISTRPHSAGPRTATPEGQCLGRHALAYALRFDADALDDVALLRESQDYRRPFLALPSRVQFDPPIRLEGEVVYSCLKGAEDGDSLVMRIFNPSSEATTACVLGPVEVEQVRLDETGGSAREGGIVRLQGGEIATLRVRASRSRAPVGQPGAGSG
jgi:alpha-mannosidase